MSKRGNKPEVRRLYHMTSTAHFQRIWAGQHLRPTESNLSMEQEHAGPDVVWLTSDPTPTQGWQRWSVLPKDEIRITVEVPRDEARHWPAWARARGITHYWYAGLVSSGGGPQAANTWYVVERAVPAAEWVRVEQIINGVATTVWEREDGQGRKAEESAA